MVATGYEEQVTIPCPVCGKPVLMHWYKDYSVGISEAEVDKAECDCEWTDAQVNQMQESVLYILKETC